MNRSFLSLTLATVVASSAAAQPAPKTYAEAMTAGRKAIASGNLAAARGPLETALTLAKTDAERLDANRALLVPYRELPEIEPMQRAAGAILAGNARPAERSLTRSALLAFVHKRGQMPAAVTGYEAQLQKTPDDPTTLYILAEAYATYTKDPAKSVAAAERLLAVQKKAGKDADPADQALLAQQYLKAGREKDAAALYEIVAAADTRTGAWNYKEAAAAWLKAGDAAKAVAAAKRAESAGPEKRNDQLAYFWHRGLADVFLDAGEAKAAVPHYETALKLNKNPGYTKDTEARLAKAKASGP